MLTRAPFPTTISSTLADNSVHLLPSAQCSPGGNTSGFFSHALPEHTHFEDRRLPSVG